jgi:hypothetical protein
MRFYATITSERDSRAGKKGGNEYLQVELSAFGKVVGYVVLEITEDPAGEPVQYKLKFAPRREAIDWVLLKQGHQSEGVIQIIQA